MVVHRYTLPSGRFLDILDEAVPDPYLSCQHRTQLLLVALPASDACRSSFCGIKLQLPSFRPVNALCDACFEFLTIGLRRDQSPPIRCRQRWVGIRYRRPSPQPF
jgi:hypothetical protein